MTPAALDSVRYMSDGQPAAYYIDLVWDQTSGGKDRKSRLYLCVPCVKRHKISCDGALAQVFSDTECDRCHRPIRQVMRELRRIVSRSGR